MAILTQKNTGDYQAVRMPRPCGDSSVLDDKLGNTIMAEQLRINRTQFAIRGLGTIAVGAVTGRDALTLLYYSAILSYTF